MQHSVDVRPVRLPSRLLQQTSTADLTTWAAALHHAAATWRLSDSTRLLGLLRAISEAFESELERRQYVADHPHEYVPAGLPGLDIDLGDAGSVLTSDDARRLRWMLDGPPGGEHAGLGQTLPPGHPIRSMLELAVNAAHRRWSDARDHGKRADQWIRDALGDKPI